MYLIRVAGKNKQADTDIDNQFSSLDFMFYDILNSVDAYVSDLYWAHSGIIYAFPVGLNKDEYESFNESVKEYTLHTDTKRAVQYMHRGFIEKFGRYVYSDNLDLAGYEDIESLKTFDPYIKDFIQSRAYIHFKCKDAVVWEIYTRNLTIIKLIDESFKYTEIIKIG